MATRRLPLPTDRKIRPRRRRGVAYCCDSSILVLIGINIVLFGHIVSMYVFSIKAPDPDPRTSHKSVQGEPPQCSPEQMAGVTRQLPPIDYCFHQPWKQKCSITAKTKCPDSRNWLVDHYRQLRDKSKFTGINVGCSHGYDAIRMLRMGAALEQADNVAWRQALGVNGATPVCGIDSNLDVDQWPKRQGQVHCIEHMPSLIKAIKNASAITGLDKQGLTVTHADISNTAGKSFYPTEDGNQDCTRGSAQGCEPVERMTLDAYTQKNIPKGRIHVLSTTNAEGADFNILKGAEQTLQRTEYVEFAYNWKGPWSEQSLQDAISYMNSLHFNCYWAGKRKLWRITNCWMIHYASHFWSNLACVNRNLVPALAIHMEQVFSDDTLGGP